MVIIGLILIFHCLAGLHTRSDCTSRTTYWVYGDLQEC